MSHQVKKASILEIIQEVERLRQEDEVQAIQPLAEIDRQTVGWLRIIVSGLVRLLWALVILVVFLLALSLWLSISVQIVYQFLHSHFPGHEKIPLVLMGIAASWIIMRAEGWRSFLANTAIWQLDVIEKRPLQLILLIYARLIQLLTAVFIGSFLLFSLLPLTVLVLLLFDWLPTVLNNWSQAVDILQTFWRPAFIILLSVVIILFMLRHKPKEKLIRLSFFVLSGVGMILIMNTFQMRSEPTWLQLANLWPFSAWQEPDLSTSLTIWEMSQAFYILMAILLWQWVWQLLNNNWLIVSLSFIAMSLIYPLGFAFSFALLFRFPYTIFYKALTHFAIRLRLRWYLLRALRQHRQRNQQQTKGDPWATVCRHDLVRFTPSKARLAYRRQLYYHNCPVCQKDNHVYTGVECIAIKLDLDMKEQQTQTGPTLFLNGLAWMRNRQSSIIPAFDTLVIGQTGDQDIDEFLITYNNKKLSPYHKPLRRITSQILKGTSLSSMEKRLLESELERVVFNYDPQVTPNACIQNVRFRDVIQKRTHSMRQVTKWSIRFIIILLLGLVGVLILRDRAWESLQPIWDELFTALVQ